MFIKRLFRLNFFIIFSLFLLPFLISVTAEEQLDPIPTDISIELTSTFTVEKMHAPSVLAVVYAFQTQKKFYSFVDNTTDLTVDNLSILKFGFVVKDNISGDLTLIPNIRLRLGFQSIITDPIKIILEKTTTMPLLQYGVETTASDWRAGYSDFVINLDSDLKKKGDDINNRVLSNVYFVLELRLPEGSDWSQYNIESLDVDFGVTTKLETMMTVD